MPAPNTSTSTSTSPPDDETLSFLSTIHANRQKLDPESQQLFDTIVDKIGAKNIPGTVAFRAKQRLSAPNQQGNFVEPTTEERIKTGASSLLAGGLDLAHGATVGMGKLAYRLGGVPQRAASAIGAELGSKFGGSTWEDADTEAGHAWRGEGPYTPAPSLNQKPIFRSPSDASFNLTQRGMGVRPNAIVDTQDAAVRPIPSIAAGALAPTRALIPQRLSRAAVAAQTAVEDLPEVQNLTRAIGSGVDEVRGVHGPRGTARAGIQFDPANPSKFVTDHEAAINHTALARDQLLSQPEGTTPSVSTEVALNEITRAANASRLSTQEAEGVARLQDVIRRKGDLVSAADLHNAVQAGGGNIPGSVRRAITPMIDANAPGYRALGEHMGDLYEGKESAAGIVNRLRTGTDSSPSRLLSGARAVGNLARGKVGRAVGNAADVVGGGEGAVDIKGLAKTTIRASRAATQHAQARGEFSANPALNTLRSTTTPEPPESPELLSKEPVASTTPSAATFAASQTGDVYPMEVPSGRGVPPGQVQSSFQPTGPTARSAALLSGPLPSPTRVPERTPITPISEPPTIAAVGSGVTANDHAAWMERINANREANIQAGKGRQSTAVPVRVFRNISGNDAEIPVGDWMKNQGVGSSPSSPSSSTPSSVSIDQSFSKGEPVRYSVGGTPLRGRVMSEVRESKHGPYVLVSSEPERGQYSILVKNLQRIARKKK